MMRTVIKICLSLMLLAFMPLEGQAKQQPTTSYELLAAMGVKSVQHFIRPTYEKLKSSTQDLHDKLAHLCQAPSSKHLREAKQGFLNVVEHWARASIIHFGAIDKDYRRERFHYWPDRKGRGAKAVRLVLKKQQNAYLSQETLAKKSIAVQGLPALELVLFGALSDKLKNHPHNENAAFACGYGEAIARNLHHIASTVLASWQKGGQDVIAFTQLSPQNKRYANQKEVVLELYKALMSQLTSLTQNKMAYALGKDKDHIGLHHLPFWRSQNAVNSLRLEVQSLWALLETSGFADLLSLSDPSQKTHLAERFVHIDELFKHLPKDTKRLLTEEPFRTEMSLIKEDLKKLHSVLEGRMAIAADLPMGFNASDGD